MKRKMLVLAALDLTEDPQRVSDELYRLTGGADLSVYCIHVIKSFPRLSYHTDANRLWEDYRDHAVIDTLARMRQYIRQFTVRYEDVEPLIDAGDPAEVIVRAAEKVKADLIVTGMRKASGFRKMVKRGTPEKTVQFSRIPVLCITL
jgi:nucleotide-binding universal stress UspA family protein